jgi:hypothetical protein
VTDQSASESAFIYIVALTPFINPLFCIHCQVYSLKTDINSKCLRYFYSIVK